MTRLVVTPSPLPTESLPGYVLHLTDANGYPGSKFILSSMRKRKDQSSVGRLDSSPLIPLAGLNKDQAARLSMQYPQKNSRDTVALVGQPISRHQIRLNDPKVCPQCLAEDHRCHALWELSLVWICPKHAVHLLSQCRRCKEPLRWHRAKTYLCKCGADLRNVRVKQVTSVEWTALASAIQSLLYQDPLNYPFPLELIAFKDFSIQQLLTLVGRMCFEIEQLTEGSVSTPARHEVKDHVPEVAKALFNWPTNFQAFLNRRYGKQLNGDADLPAFRHVFSWVPRKRLKSLSDVDPEMRMVAQEVFRFGAKYWSHELMSRGPQKGVNKQQCQWGCVSDAVRISGSHIQTVRRGMAMGEIPCRFALSSRSKRVELVSLEWAKDYAAKTSGFKSQAMRAAARRIGIPVATLRELRIKGHFTLPPPHIKRTHGFFIHELDAFERKVLDKQRSIDSVKQRRLIDLKALLKSSYSDTDKKVKLLEEVITGRIKIFGKVKKMGGVKVDAKSVSDYWRPWVRKYLVT